MCKKQSINRKMEKIIVIYSHKEIFTLVNKNNSFMPHHTGSSKCGTKWKIKSIPCIQSSKIEKNKFSYNLLILHLYVQIL